MIIFSWPHKDGGLETHVQFFANTIDTPDGPREKIYWFLGPPCEEIRAEFTHGPFDTIAEAYADIERTISQLGYKVKEMNWDSVEPQSTN